MDEVSADGRERPALPPVLYLPRSETDQASQDLQLLRLADGRTALLTYTALDRLLDCCGAQQPWLLLETRRLAQLDELLDFDLILIDQELPAELRRTADR